MNVTLAIDRHDAAELVDFLLKLDQKGFGDNSPKPPPGALRISDTLTRSLIERAKHDSGTIPSRNEQRRRSTVGGEETTPAKNIPAD